MENKFNSNIDHITFGKSGFTPSGKKVSYEDFKKDSLNSSLNAGIPSNYRVPEQNMYSNINNPTFFKTSVERNVADSPNLKTLEVLQAVTNEQYKETEPYRSNNSQFNHEEYAQMDDERNSSGTRYNDESADIRKINYNWNVNLNTGIGNDTDLRDGYRKAKDGLNYGLKVAKDAATTMQLKRLMSNQGEFSVLNQELTAYGISKIDLLPTISSTEFNYNMDILAKDLGYSSIVFNSKELRNGYAYGIVNGKGKGNQSQKVKINLDKINMNPVGFTETTARNYVKAYADTYYAKQQNAIANTKRINQLIDNVSKYKRMDLKRMNSAEIMKHLKLLDGHPNRSKFAAFNLNAHEKEIVAMIAATKKIDEAVIASNTAHKDGKGFYKKSIGKRIQGADLVDGYTQTVKGTKLIKRAVSAQDRYHVKNKRKLEKRMTSKNSIKANKAKTQFEKLYGEKGSYTKKQQRKKARKEKSLRGRISKRKTSIKASVKMKTMPIKAKVKNTKAARLLRTLTNGLKNTMLMILKSFIAIIANVFSMILPPLLIIYLITGLLGSCFNACANLNTNSSSETVNDAERTVFNRLNDNHGLNYGQIAGIMGNMSYDSQYSPFYLDEHFGLGSWNIEDIDTITDTCQNNGWGDLLDDDANKAFDAQMKYLCNNTLPNFNSSADNSKDGAMKAAEDYYYKFINQNDDGSLGVRKEEAGSIYDKIMEWTGGNVQDNPSIDPNGAKRLNETFIWPTESDRITSNWGDTADRDKPHQGIDIGAVQHGVKGDPIYAVADGDVIIAGQSATAGNWVRIRHSNGYISVYMHMDQILVKTGQKVVQGEQIGKMGTTGQSTGVHLHFAIMKNSGNHLIYVNPWEAK